MDAAWQQIDGGEQPVGNGTKLPHDYMSAEMTAKEAGFAYVYFSNENASLIEFYIDDVTMTYTPGNVIQYNEYYNHGSLAANSWTRPNTTGNNYLANGGTELNTTSQLYDLDYRNYDPVLGRMNGVDPMASKYSSYSPYNFAFNDPVSFNDPSGADPIYSETTLASFGRPMRGGYFGPQPMDNNGYSYGGYGGGDGFGGSSGITYDGAGSWTIDMGAVGSNGGTWNYQTGYHNFTEQGAWSRMGRFSGAICGRK